MATFDSPSTSYPHNDDCFSASELAYQAAKGCLLGATFSSFAPIAIYPGTAALGFCAGGALLYGADSLIDSIHCGLQR